MPQQHHHFFVQCTCICGNDDYLRQTTQVMWFRRVSRSHLIIVCPYFSSFPFNFDNLKNQLFFPHKLCQHLQNSCATKKGLQTGLDVQFQSHLSSSLSQILPKLCKVVRVQYNLMDSSHNFQSRAEQAKQKLLKVIELTPENKWEQKENKDGYLIHSRTDTDTGMKMSRTTTIMPFTAEEILAVIADVTQRANYDEKFESGQVLKVLDEHTRINYNRGKSPAPLVSPRDIVALGAIYRNPDNSIILVAQSIEVPEMPPQKGYERAQLILAGWILKPLENGSTEATTVACMDPKGNMTKIANSDKGSQMQGKLVRSIVAYLGKLKAQKK